MAQNRIAIVTGATRLKGIGKAICTELARQGNDIFFTYFREYDKTMPWGVEDGEPELIQKEIEALGVRCAKMELDLGKTESAGLVLDQTEKLLGNPSILINNAAYSTQTDVNSLTAEELDKHYFVNQRGTILLSLEFIRRFKQEKFGRIINLTTGQSLGAMGTEIAYAITKAAIESFTRMIQHEIGFKNITINTVNPGITDTGWMDQETHDKFIHMAPRNRYGEPQDAANLIAFLASEKADWISGQTIHSEGGFFR
ncbi:MAG: SDR family oxidoreductase [Bacteroidales bacterium]|nr:SDR family oxidoreductase [Bacteroidales bacterium]